MFAKSSESNVKHVLVNTRTTLVLLSLFYRGIPNHVNIFTSVASTTVRLYCKASTGTRGSSLSNDFACNVFKLYSLHLNNIFVHFVLLGGTSFLVDTEIVTDSWGAYFVRFCK